MVQFGHVVPEQDLDEAYRFYESQPPVLGSYFLDSLYSDIDSLAYSGGVHQLVFRYHRLLCKRFPFALYYRLIENTAVVFAVLDCRMSQPRARLVVAIRERRVLPSTGTGGTGLDRAFRSGIMNAGKGTRLLRKNQTNVFWGRSDDQGETLSLRKKLHDLSWCSVRRPFDGL